MTTRILFYDTETTGLPVWGEPSGGDNQPHLVQLAARLVDADTRAILQTIDLIIQPDGWKIPEEMTEIHGISTEYAADVGVPEDMAVNLLMTLWARCEKRVGHSEGFDARILRIALKRYLGDASADEWKAGTAECTGRMGQKVMATGSRMPKLVEAHEHFTGLQYEGAHSALADVDACMAVYFAIKDEEVDAEFMA